jgi:hypothetical protein
MERVENRRTLWPAETRTLIRRLVDARHPSGMMFASDYRVDVGGTPTSIAPLSLKQSP